jgi:hypothetical protein
MTPQVRSRRLAYTLAASIAAFALAAPTVTARAAEQFLDPPTLGPPSFCESYRTAKYRVPARVSAFRSCDDKVFASRGTGAPARPAAPAKTTETATFPGLAATARDATRQTSTGSGFDWASAAAGATGGAGLIALVSFGAPALRSRRRLRTAR